MSTTAATAPLRLETVTDRPGLDLFLELGYTLRQAEVLFVPQLRRDMKTLLDRRKHPFHEHAQVEYFICWRGDKPVGRIAAIENFAHNQFHGEKIGFFGFLDAITDQEVFTALLKAAEDWARGRGLTALRGPCSFSTNEECGLLVHGFDTPATLMTPHNPITWPPMVEAAGYAKAKDLLHWWADDNNWTERVQTLAKRVRDKFARKGEKLVIRGLDTKRFAEELGYVRTIYNAAWEKNWGFVPMTDAEIDFLAKEMRPVIVPELVRFAFIDGKPVGFSFTMPDYNVVLRHLNGRIGPKEIALFLLLKSRIKHIRVLTMGVVSEFRNRGLETLLISDTVDVSRSLGMRSAETGWILEDNALMNRSLEAMGARHYRTHRIYEKSLTP